MKLKDFFGYLKKGGVLLGVLCLLAPLSAQDAVKDPLEGVKVGGMLRVRPDFLFNRNFVASNDISYFNEKAWITIGKDFTPNSRLFFRIQDARIWGSYVGGEGGLTTSTELESLDLREAYMLFGDMFDGNLAVQIGRMRLIYGDQRLVGSLDWTDVGRSFDGLRLKIKPMQDNKLDIWSVLMVEGDAFVPPVDHIMFSGIYDTMKFSDDFLMDLYVLHKLNMDAPDALNFFTIGARFTNRTQKGKSVSPLDWTLEGAYQLGSNSLLDMSAYAAAAVVGYTIDDIVRIGLEADIGSGDTDAADGIYGTFDNLIPTNHIYYGQVDFLSWKNMLAFNANATLFPGKMFQVKAGYWYASRLTEQDLWYGASGAASSINLAGVAGLELFHEIDLTVDYKPWDFLSLQGGFSYVIPGAAPVSTGATVDYYYAYLSSTMSF